MLVIKTITRWEMMGSPQIVDLLEKQDQTVILDFTQVLELAFKLNSQFAQPAIQNYKTS